MNRNITIYNYLNLINPRFGEYYKQFGIDFLPKDFLIDEDLIKSRLFLNQMSDCIDLSKYEECDKKKIKKMLKNSIENIKNFKKHTNFDVFSKNFAEKLDFYLNFRAELTKMILRDFGKFDFDETKNIEEILMIDPVMSSLTPDFFDDKFDNKFDLTNLEEKYELLYLEKSKILKKRKNRKSKALAQQIEEQNVVQSVKTLEKTEKEIESEKPQQKIENFLLDNSTATIIKGDKTKQWYKHQMFHSLSAEENCIKM